MITEFVLRNRNLIIKLNGELDEYSAQTARTKIDNRIDEGGFDTVIFDLGKLSFMDSTGIGMLIGRYKKISKRNAGCFIANTGRQVEKVLMMTGIYDIMPRVNNGEVI